MNYTITGVRPLALVRSFMLINTFHASLTKEYLHRGIITSELGTCGNQGKLGHGKILFIGGKGCYIFQNSQVKTQNLKKKIRFCNLPHSYAARSKINITSTV